MSSPSTSVSESDSVSTSVTPKFDAFLDEDIEPLKYLPKPTTPYSADLARALARTSMQTFSAGDKLIKRAYEDPYLRKELDLIRGTSAWGSVFCGNMPIEDARGCVEADGERLKSILQFTQAKTEIAFNARLAYMSTMTFERACVNVWFDEFEPVDFLSMCWALIEFHTTSTEGNRSVVDRVQNIVDSYFTNDTIHPSDPFVLISSLYNEMRRLTPVKIPFSESYTHVQKRAKKSKE